MDASKNLQNMKKLDHSWNAQDLETLGDTTRRIASCAGRINRQPTA
jgi:hypothetical protein